MASRERRRELKLEALARYSRGKVRCHWCKDDDVDVLAIDHKRNDGAAERRQHGKRGHAFYQWLKKNGWPKGYAVLCFSCNFSKHVNGGQVSLYRFRRRKRW